MDPDFYRSPLPNRYTTADINQLLSEQTGINPVSGLGLGAGFTAHSQLTSAAAVAARSFGQLQGYAGHNLHSSSIPESPLQNLGVGQGAYKSLQFGQPHLTDPYAGLRNTSQSSISSGSKPMFSQDSASLPGSASLDVAPKAWGLQNFVSQANPYFHHGDLQGMDFALGSQQLMNPPPAHSSKATTHLQRNPYSATDMFAPTRSTKTPPISSVYDTPSSHPSLSASSQPSLFLYSQPSSFPVKNDLNLYSLSDMNYEAVSPAAPDPQTNQQQSDSYISLQDLASISSTQQKLEVNNAQSLIKRPPSAVQDPINKSLQKPKTIHQQHQDLYNGQGGQISQMKQSPQPSPISVGGSPQISQMVSPPPAPIPVQAPADSTTKPKKPRIRKKKEVTQPFTGQTFSQAQELSQRNSSNDFMSTQQQQQQQQQQVYLQNRNQVYSSAPIDTGPTSASLMASSMNQQFAKGQTQTVYAKSTSSPAIVHHPVQNQSAANVQQPESSLGLNYQSSQTTSQSSLTYSVSDALEMSREAVFPNQGLLENYGSNELSPFNMQESFSSQLGLGQVEGMRRGDMFNSNEEGVFVNNQFGGQFVSPNSVLNMDMAASHQGGGSTIDEAAFSSLMNENFQREMSPDKRFKPGSEERLNYFPLTVKVDAEIDDDLAHLANDPVDRKASGIAPSQQQPAANPKPTVRNASGGTSFMDSYLNFLQGKKPETLSSMSSAIIHNKPQLPKYIPEPPRPRRVEQEVANTSSGLFNLKSDLPKKSQTSVIFTDEEDSEIDDSAVKNAITRLSGENDKVKFSTNSKTGGLTMKINLTKLKKAEEKAKLKKLPKTKKRTKDKDRKFGLKEPYHDDSSADEKNVVKNVPSRQLSSRKAKEAIAKYKDSDSDSDTLKPIRKLGEEGSDEAYDSDRDPVWTPFKIDKKVPGFESTLDKRRSRGRGKGKVSRSRKAGDPSFSLGPVSKVPRLGEAGAPLEVDSGSDEEQLEGVPPITEELQVGDFVLEKKDQTNMETYSIWKIEPGRMLHKFELFTENSKILHRAIPTFSSWLPSMKNSYVHVRVRSVLKQGDKEHVEVLEEYRPKPGTKLGEHYEEHPLVEAFNVYLQIFLSQALEPGFLCAIREANERFYLDSLEKIEASVQERLVDIDSKVQWRDKFRDAVKAKPHIRELDRPNLKQACQACEFASQPAIKSIHLFGNKYDRFSLKELPNDGSQGSQEFMIGKTAAKFVKPYHTLFHYKYNLFKRCLAKVNFLKDGKVGDNAAILDQCLQNRAWVLQIFEDLKQMLEKG